MPTEFQDSSTVPTSHAKLGQSNANVDGTTAPFRVGGSGFTVFQWLGNAIGFAQTISHQSPQPVAAPVAIQPMDSIYPKQIIVPAAIGPGTLQVQLFEMYNQKVWDKIMAVTDRQRTGGGVLTTYDDLAEIFIRLSALSQPINCTKIIYPSNAGDRFNASRTRAYADTYLNCMITDIRDDEQIDIGTMEVVKNMTIQYTRTVRSFNNT